MQGSRWGSLSPESIVILDTQTQTNSKQGIIQMFKTISDRVAYQFHSFASTPDGEGREEGQGMAEYGLIRAGVALLAIVAVFALGPKIGSLLNKVSASLT
jgi:Flp pilus assembly pilin Flp